MLDFPLQVSESNLERHIRELARIGNLGKRLEDGFFRRAWSSFESAAMDHIEQDALSAGLSTWYDSVGNLYAAHGDRSSVVLTGSHLDTVRDGGNYDGAIGVYGGLEAIKAIKASGKPLTKGIAVVAWRGEESDSWNLSYKGSRAAFGVFDPSYLEHQFLGTTLRDAIESQHFNVDTIHRRVPAVGTILPDQIHAYLELHIEQARKLEIDNHDIGVVTSIRGNKRIRMWLEGDADHSGGTPMGIPYRRDANLAGAHIAVAIDELARSQIDKGFDLVQTQGVLNSNKGLNLNDPRIYQQGLTKVPALQYSDWDFRSQDETFLSRYVQRVGELAQTISSRMNVTCRIEPLSTSGALPRTDKKIQDYIESSATRMGYSSQRMPSGPGHDAQIVGSQAYTNTGCGLSIPVGMIFVPCRNGKSHHPLEFATPEQIHKGANVLAQTMYELAK